MGLPNNAPFLQAIDQCKNKVMAEGAAYSRQIQAVAAVMRREQAAKLHCRGSVPYPEKEDRPNLHSHHCLLNRPNPSPLNLPSLRSRLRDSKQSDRRKHSREEPYRIGSDYWNNLNQQSFRRHWLQKRVQGLSTS